ncbi:MAG: DUF952 domain-containing protein [Magnetospirillum sp.]|nr:DUF952 domain-containing protein [Magnetospirillum sp.]
MSTAPTIYHLCRRDEWEAALPDGAYPGSSQDRADGFIHFSTRAQVEDSAARHRAGQEGLVVVAVAADRVGDALRWEPSRSGVLFPHLYAPLPVTAVRWVRDLALGPAGRHQFPALED